MMTQKLKLFSFNCRGLGNDIKRRSVFKWLKKQHGGIVLVQETHSTNSIENKWRKEWDGEIFFSHGTSKSRGVMILIPPNLSCVASVVHKDEEGRLLIIDLKSDFGHLVVANTYVQTKDNPPKQIDFLKSLSQILETYNDSGIMVGGDFNICQNEHIDKKGGRPQNISKAAKQLETLKENHNLIDIWRTLNPDLQRYTRRQNSKSGLVQSRLDYWLISTYLMYDIDNSKIFPGLQSDHSVVSLTLNLTDQEKRGRGFFKFNNSLLEDKHYVELIKTTIKDFTAENKIENKGLLWDCLKCKIRGATISYSSAIARKKREMENDLLNKINVLESNLTAETLDEYNTYKKELEDIYMHKGKGIMLRSKAKLIENDEKPTKYFLRQENQNYKNKHIRSLIVNEETITDPEEILTAEKDFYENLYTMKNEQNESCDELFAEIPTLSQEEQQLCENPISMEEILNSLKDLPNNKTPGSDGLTTNFYKFFWIDIKEHVFNSFMYAFENGSLSIEQKRGILNIIPKKGKDLRYLKNWRPISLLNTDYKILTKLLANRLQKVIPSIVSPDQNGYIKNRSIGQNIRTMVDVIEHTNQKNIPGIILQLDFEKAFDSVSWQFLDKTITMFHFGDQFRQWIRLIYNNPECCVTNNGYHSEFFQLSRGVRQGCPISALLFLLVVEIMAINIRRNKKIPGITIEYTEVKISQLADDTSLFLKDLNSVNALFNFLDYFGACSGLHLNKSKSEAIWLGPNNDINESEQPLNLNWNKSFFKCLGIWCHTNTDLMIDKNYKERLSKLKNILNIWQQRSLSLKGKITVLWSIALPQLLYVTSVLYTPKWVIDEADRLMLNFLWSNKKPHVKKSTIIAKIEEGGLKMVHFHSMVKAIKLNWIKRFVNTNSTYTKMITECISKNLTLEDFIRCNINEVDRKAVKNNFYNQIFMYWSSIYNEHPHQPNDIYNQLIWYNSFIKIDNKPVFKKKWWEKGIKYIHDIIDKHGMMIPLTELEQRFNIEITDMEYNGLVQAIPSSWQKILRQSADELKESSLTVTIKHKKWLIKDVKCSHYYAHFVSEISKPPTAVMKWNELYEVDDLSWQSIYLIPFKCCEDTKLQSFQYKILNRFFPCRYILHLWKLENSDTCTHCNENESDTIEHYFYQCPSVFLFWKSFCKWWKNVYGFFFSLKEVEVILGIINDNDDLCFDVMNYCILLAKFYLYSTKMAGGKVFILSYLHLLKNNLEVLKTLYHLKGKETDFESKWSPLYNSL